MAFHGNKIDSFQGEVSIMCLGRLITKLDIRGRERTLNLGEWGSSAKSFYLPVECHSRHHSNSDMVTRELQIFMQDRKKKKQKKNKHKNN
jgi:hypothetical protein